MKLCLLYITIIVAIGMTSCSSSKKLTPAYYQQNDSAFQSLKRRFKDQYEARPFSVEYKDKAFQEISLEIITDTIKYIYNFRVDEARLSDTLAKYNFDVSAMHSILVDMRQVHCTWINNLDYYEKQEKKYLVYMSIRHKDLKSFLRSEKYFTLAFFDRPQRFDAKGRLVDRLDRKTLFKINGGLFWRINDRVCYSLSSSFR